MTALETIASQFLDERGWSRKTPLPRDQVRQWLQSDDLTILAAAFDLLQNKNAFTRVEPPFTPQEKRVFLTRYFDLALPHVAKVYARVQNGEDEDDEIHDHEWPFQLSHALAYWIADFLRDEATPECERENLLVWLRDLVLNHPNANLVTTAVLDHLVWNRATKRYFKSWHKDPELAFLFSP